MLMWKDTTGKSSDCPKPLSRKKLKQLMPKNNGLTARGMFRNYGRMSPQMKRDLANAERDAAIQAKAREQAQGVVDEQVSEIDTEVTKGDIRQRLGKMFGNLRNRVERANRKGK